MNQNYHYFVVKTLAIKAGFQENPAQAIAHFSQQIDDFILSGRIILDQEPPAFFLENNYAKKIGTLDKWLFTPCPTGIDVLLSIQPDFQRKAILPFHFIPKETLSAIETAVPIDRSQYRCVRAHDDPKLIIKDLVTEAVNCAKQDQNDVNLMRLGMALHTYADTYSHCYFSGLNGWENKLIIDDVKNMEAKKENKKEDITMDELLYELLPPPIGHARAGHTPDICDYYICLSMKNKDGGGFDFRNERYNKDSFSVCSREILDFLCAVTGKAPFSDDDWKTLSQQLDTAEHVPDETDTGALEKHWSLCFPSIQYHYKKDDFFSYQAQFADNIDEKIAALAAHIDISKEDTKDIYSEAGNVMRNVLDITFDKVSPAFFDYNQIAYERIEAVTGKKQYGLTDDEADYFNRKLSHIGWQPKGDIAYIVDAAGFLYDPEQDIIYSSLWNIQRRLGYCDIYDLCAPLIGSIIDSEPIVFNYNGYEWMIELWKGQYGLETGCEIGIYKRKAGNFSLPSEGIINMYDCVPDTDMMKMSLTLSKKGEKLFSRKTENHWWLTGFKWGEFSEPEDLTVDYSIQFPNGDMLNAFVNELKNMNYTYLVNGLVVEFTFSKLYHNKSQIIGIRESVREKVRDINQKLCDLYAFLKKLFGALSNDPNNFRLGSSANGWPEELLQWFAGVMMYKMKGNDMVRDLLRTGTFNLKNVIDGKPEKLSSIFARPENLYKSVL
jgi:hypothetical protein